MTDLISRQNGAAPISSHNMVRFLANVPIEIALQCPDGVRVEGRYGDRVKYTLTDDRTMYVAPLVAERIKQLDIQAGELFHICKRRTKNGHRTSVQWLVERPGDTDAQLEQDLRASIENAKSRTNPQPAPTNEPPTGNLETSRVDASSDDSPHVTNGSHNPAPSWIEHSTEETKPPIPDTQLAHALKTAVAAAADAEKFAKGLDYNIRFTTEDVRAMGITILIGMQQRLPR
jgi:hypothetical protein